MHSESLAPQIALDALRRLVHALRRASHGSAGQLSGAQRFVLRELAAAPATTIASLATRTHTDPSSVSVVVTRLVEAGLCKRTPSPSDRRRMAIDLTAKGRRLAQRGPEPVQERLVTAIETLPRRDVVILARLLQGLTAEIGVPGLAPMFFEEPGK
jgi:DNA-binding MarR family transcriptional regulator